MIRSGAAEQPEPRYFLIRPRRLISEFRAVALSLFWRAGLALAQWRESADELTKDSIDGATKRKRKRKEQG
jgi:hypothetical protein